MDRYPSSPKIKQMLRYNLTKPFRKKILKAFIIGSEANRSSSEKSDLDVAIVIEKMKTKSSLKFTEQYHSYFTEENQKPKWAGRIIDFQFFFKEDKELNQIKKIEV